MLQSKKNQKTILMKNLYKLIFGALIVISAQTANSQNTWSQKASITATQRGYAVAFTLGKFGYVGCGQYASGGIKDFWRWNQNTNTWSVVAPYPGNGAVGCIAFTVGDTAYVGLGDYGGTEYNDLWAYDSSTNSWRQRASFPGLARYSPFCFTINGIAYVGCGTPGGPPYYDDVWKFDPKVNKWTQLNNYPGGLKTGLITFVLGKTGYVGAGCTDINHLYDDFWKYNPVTDSWTSINPLPMPGGVSGGVGFNIGGIGYAGSGNNTGPSYIYSRDFWSYDTTTGNWTPIETLPGASRTVSVSFTIGFKGYVATGSSDSVGYLTDTWEFANISEGVNEIADSKTSVQLYPNPNNGQFTIQLANSQQPITNSQVEVYNMLGEKVYSNSFNTQHSTFKIDLSGESTGVYLYRVISEAGNVISDGKFIIQK
jgi:N-acetylneuraminic acid mutarotase